MKRVTFVVMTLLCLGLASTHADAARLGGGKSSGIQRDNVMQRQASSPVAPANQAQPGSTNPAAPAPQPSPWSRWLGPLAGLALGAGLASMFMGGGGGMGGVLLIALLVAAAFFLFSTLRRRQGEAANLQYAGGGVAFPQPVAAPFGASGIPLQPVAMASALPASRVSVPAGFDVEKFLRQAKLNFMRLQAANDHKDLHDIRNFATPEMFAEISLQAQERGAEPQQTDVTELNAELLDVTEGSEEHLASVRFYGALRETPAAAPEAFDEVWHLAKPAGGQGGWLIAGIQQFA
jgi:predicted lipid-binding transport protein (Tim44 family)